MRLTKSDKKAIRNEIIKKTVDVKLDEIEKEIAEKFEEYLININKPYSQFIKKLKKTPMFFGSKSFIVRDSEYMFLNINLDKEYPIWSEWLYNASWRSTPVIYLDKSDKYYKVFVDLYNKKKQIEKDKDEMRRTIDELFAAVSTDSGLVKVFPDIAEYVDLSKYKIYPVVPNSDKLLNMLNYYPLKEVNV